MSQQKFVEHNISTYRKDAGLRTLRGRLFKCFFLRFYHTGVRRLRPVRRQRTLCGIRFKSFGILLVSAPPLCGDSDLCDPDRNQSAVVGCFERTPLFEDCDLCDQKQITGNIRCSSTSCVVQCMVWYCCNRGWTTNNTTTHPPTARGETKKTRLVLVESSWLRSFGLVWFVRGPVWMCGYCLPFSMKTMKETYNLSQA